MNEADLVALLKRLKLGPVLATLPDRPAGPGPCAEARLGVVPTTVVYRREAGGRLPMAVWGLAKL